MKLISRATQLARSTVTLALGLLAVVSCASPPPERYRNTQELKEGLAAGKVTLIDVRSSDEYRGGHIPGAINIPHTEIADHLAELPKGRDIVVYCKAGRRSQKALEILRSHGYGQVYNFGGVGQWREALVQ